MTNRTLFVQATLTAVMTSMLVTAGAWAEPAPPPEVKKTVDAFVGRWNLEGTIAMPGATPQKAAVMMDCKKTAKGKGVACTLSGAFDGSAMVAYDFYTKAVRFMAVTSDDEVHDHKCRWKSDQKVVCEPLKGGMSGMAVTEDLEFTTAPNKLGFKAVVTMPDGGKGTCEFMSK